MDIDQLVESSRASQNKEELRELLRVLKDIEVNFALEVGIHKGHSLELWKKLHPEAVVIGIENDLHALDLEATKDCIIVDKDSHSQEALDQVKATLDRFPLDFLFLDGDHHYDSVKKDFEMYAPLVRKGGIIALHDVVIMDNDSVEVYKFWHELKQQFPKTRTIHLGGTGVGVIIL